MDREALAEIILESWKDVANDIANGSLSDCTGRKKEQNVVRHVGTRIKSAHPNVSVSNPDFPPRFQPNRSFGYWFIDLVCGEENKLVAVEAKFKTRGDGAVPDNRKAAFFDLFKLEQYVASGQYSSGLFLWLTNQDGYLTEATGESRDFSTHQNRRYLAGTKLHAVRARNDMPLPLELRGSYVFTWKDVIPGLGWYSLFIEVTDKEIGGDP